MFAIDARRQGKTSIWSYRVGVFPKLGRWVVLAELRPSTPGLGHPQRFPAARNELVVYPSEEFDRQLACLEFAHVGTCGCFGIIGSL